METNKEQYERIKHILPIQRGNITVDNITFINALLYICDNGCKWRKLPKEYGKWHIIYKRFEPWEYDKELYKLRNEIERFFRLLQGFRRVFCRFDKLDTMYSGFIMLALIFIYIK